MQTCSAGAPAAQVERRQGTGAGRYGVHRATACQRLMGGGAGQQRAALLQTVRRGHAKASQRPLLLRVAAAAADGASAAAEPASRECAVGPVRAKLRGRAGAFAWGPESAATARRRHSRAARDLSGPWRIFVDLAPRLLRKPSAAARQERRQRRRARAARDSPQAHRAGAPTWPKISHAITSLLAKKKMVFIEIIK